MAQSTVFLNNRTQAVRLPAEMRFPDSVKKVVVCKVGNTRVITPVGSDWDSFFAEVPKEDILPARQADLPETSREQLED